MKVSEELKKNYEIWTQRAVEDLCDHVNRLREDGTDKAATIETIFSIAHDIKGMGGSFDYPLMTEAGQALCSYITDAGAPENCQVDKLEAYCRILNRVMTEQLSGDGGTAGRALISELHDIAAE